MFAQAMASGMAEYEQEIAPLKRRLFAQLLGGLGASEAAPAQLLEVGVGTGPNLPFYAEFYATAGHPAGDAAAAAGSREAAAAATAPPPSAAQALPPLHITGLDPNPYMREYLQQNLKASGWPAQRFSWVRGQAEALPLPDASRDAVVCTLVLCSVDEVAPVLAEAARVLKPGGSLLFIEHTTAGLQARPLLWLAQRALEPLQRALADNCHLSRDPLPAIQAEFGERSPLAWPDRSYGHCTAPSRRRWPASRRPQRPPQCAGGAAQQRWFSATRGARGCQPPLQARTHRALLRSAPKPVYASKGTARALQMGEDAGEPLHVADDVKPEGELEDSVKHRPIADGLDGGARAVGHHL
ncbi:methyltransferase 7A [Micractinium conductrix]|uniref:Methyltransferase 7A n=1 Tax=Micractinium conductrix TaxID=554055 RepID=A0A2P6VR58_9CHLO|nr:methyltransferase 7A [Micractinium conductrix]|eukprot:PSC76561.1 methyltransferase 7A [Micractinium conductrix]